MTLAAFQTRFESEEACRAHREAVRWPHGPVCPAFGVVRRAGRLRRNPAFLPCRDCGHQFSVTSGTALHGTRVPLCKWCTAIGASAGSRAAIRESAFCLWKQTLQACCGSPGDAGVLLLAYVVSLGARSSPCADTGCGGSENMTNYRETRLDWRPARCPPSACLQVPLARVATMSIVGVVPAELRRSDGARCRM